MAVPKYKTSKAKGRSRLAANMRLAMPTLSPCGNCGNIVPSHQVCPKCGFYRGVQVKKVEE